VHSGRCSRRTLVLGCAPASAVLLSQPAVLPAAASTDDWNAMRARLEAPLVAQAGGTAPAPGRTLPPLPSWLAGRWQCEQTLRQYSTPQGVQYIGAAGRPLSEAEASAAQTRLQLGKVVSLELRWRALPDGGALEDRPFNVQSRLDAFAGRQVVRAADTCSEAGVDSPGLACTFVEFNGPILQKVYVNSMRAALSPSGDGAGDGAFISSETTRSILARRLVKGDTRNFPPLTADSEVVINLVPTTPTSATGRLRLIEYLNPNDPLYFAAGGKSVSISDYSLALTRL